MRPIGLEYLSTFGMQPARYIELAARTGFSSVGLNLGGAANPVGPGPRYNLRHAPELRPQISQALRDTGIGLSLMEGFAITPASDVAQFSHDLDWVAAMGAKAICAVSLERDRARSRDQFALLTALARARGLATTTEVGAGILKDLERSLAMVRSVDDPGFSLLIDTMHFFRSGAGVDDFAALEPGMIGHIQLCDVPMPALVADYMDEALNERRMPGDGDLPLQALARLIPAEVTVGLEIPARSQLVGGAITETFLRTCLRRSKDLWTASTGDSG